MVWRPPWGLGHHAESFEHDSAWERVVRSTGAGKGAVQVGINQDRVSFSGIRSV